MPIDTVEQTAPATSSPTGDTTLEPSSSEPQTGQKKSKARFDWKHFTLSKAQKIWLSVAAVFFLLLTVAGVLFYKTFTVVQAIQAEGLEAKVLAQQGYSEFKSQNLPAVKETLNQLGGRLERIDSLYSELSFYAAVPIASRYYNDGLHGLAAGEAGLAAAHKSIDSITPYADVLGFTGEGTFTGGTTEDRLKIILETLEKITPELDLIAADLDTVRSELASIDPDRYPEKIRDTEVRSYIVQAQDYSAGAVSALTDFRPVIEQLPSIAGGNDQPKKYLVLFQNDNELRPTGGFLTAYAIIKVENGKVIPEKSDDIYELDKKFNSRLPIPEALGRYLTTERYWNLRDMNISPDFKLSMDQFYEHYLEVPGEPDDIDGIIAVDTEFLKALITVLGPVTVPGYGTFSGEADPKCDCPQIIYALSEIITRPTPYIREDRKGILGPLMREMLTKAYGAPKQQWPSLFELGWQSVQNRHIQFYFIDEAHQASAELLNGAGTMTSPSNDQDFIAIVNANLGGAKSNLFTEYEVKQTVSAPLDGRIEKTVDITYRNTRKGDNCNLEAGLLCLNATLRDWTRLYLPTGAELVSANGFTAEPKTYQENGFSVIDGFFILEPQSSAKVTLTYTVPYTAENYVLNIWKQGGIKEYKLLMDVTGGEEELIISKDTQYSTEF